MDTIDRVRDSFGHPLQIEGILLTMFDERTNLGNKLPPTSGSSSRIMKFFGP